MIRYFILSIFLSNFAHADSNWSSKVHEGEVIILFDEEDKEFSPDLKGLENLLLSAD